MDEPIAPESQAFVPTTATTLGELVQNAFFVAASIDAPVVDVVNPHTINLHYPADGSLATVRVEARPGAWGGIGPHGTSEDESQRNEHYDDMLAAATPAPPEEPAQEV
jgi:hypothetical protein